MFFPSERFEREIESTLISVPKMANNFHHFVCAWFGEDY